MPLVYLDNNATTRTAPEVVAAMEPFWSEWYGNPSSMHRFGASVAEKVDQARTQVAALLGAQRPGEILFTSGGTESNNLAILGVCKSTPAKKHIITTEVEHSAILQICKGLEREGYRITYLPVSKEGGLNLKDLEDALTPETLLVSIMWANNETGAIFPVAEVAEHCKRYNVLCHVDAIQAVGKIPIHLQQTGIHLLSLSGHKMHGPKGVGALYIRRGTPIAPLMRGGTQEKNLRPGTLNVPGIVGLGKAAALAETYLKSDLSKKMEASRNFLESDLKSKLQGININAVGSPRLPNTSSIRFDGCEGEAIALLLSEKEVAVSTGSACSAGSLDPSHVLKAMGLASAEARSTVRISLSHETTPADLNTCITALLEIVPKLRKKIRR